MMFHRISSVVSAPLSTALTTVETVKLDLAITDDSTNDKYFALLIQRGSDAVSAWCRRVFGVQTVQDTFRIGNPIGGTSDQLWPPEMMLAPLTLSQYPVLAITSVITDTATLVPGTDYECDTASGQLYALNGDGTRSSWNFNFCSVIYQAGYYLPLDIVPQAPYGTRTLPSDLEQACIELVRARWYSRARDPMLRTREQPAKGSESFWVGKAGIDAEMPDEVASLLDPHRAVVVA